MKKLFLFTLLTSVAFPSFYAKAQSLPYKKSQPIITLVDQYSDARERQDTLLLKSILTSDIDQLVSTGEWREGIKGSMAGMVRSSATSPNSRILKVEKVRFITKRSAIADARYTIQNSDGSTREMWSTFIVVKPKGKWLISAIRNMLPAAQR
jgi:uncharacterized protein (TIGR02246 family)